MNDMRTAIERGNALLEDDNAKAADLAATLGQVHDVHRELQAQPLPDPEAALNLEQREQAEAQRRQAQAERQIVGNVVRELERRLKAAKHREAVARADSDRQAMDKALDAAARAAEKAARARDEAHAEMRRFGQAKIDTGRHPSVGAAPEQIDRLVELLGTPSGDVVMLRNRYQRGT